MAERGGQLARHSERIIDRLCVDLLATCPSPGCAELVDPGAFRCPVCGTRIQPNAAELADAQEAGRPRFIVTELLGFLDDTARTPGLSCMMVDTLGAHTVQATFRSEDVAARVSRETKHGRARRLAAELCERLNGAVEQRGTAQ